jgi:hypothetical protein
MSNLYRRALFATCVFAATCAVDFGVRAAGPFDGTYAGESPVAGSVSPSCKDYHMTVVVKDGHFNTVVLTIPFSVDVSADGAFSATALRPGGRGGVGAMTGKISGGTMTIDYHAADCAHHAVLTRT